MLRNGKERCVLEIARVIVASIVGVEVLKEASNGWYRFLPLS
jgi:hypothetical protein